MKVKRKGNETNMSTSYNLTERETQILELFVQDSSISASTLSEMLSVSSVTIRSNLSSLEEKGFLVRTHGGAVSAFHPAVLSRLRNNSEVKKRIAKAASAHIVDGATVMIEAGSTTALIARYILGKRNIHIVTDSTLLLPYVRINPSVSVTLVGGAFHPETESMVGPIALKQLSDFHVDIAFVGGDGFSIEKGLTSNLTESAEVIRYMYDNSQKTILTVDSSKYGRTGFSKALALDKLDLIISDSGLDLSIESDIKEIGVNVELV